MKVGILAIQGDFYLHKKSFDIIGVETLFVRKFSDFKEIDSLIIPGGESTTMSLLLSKYKLDEVLYDFSLDHTVFGICAGSILISKNSNDKRIKNLNIMQFDSVRNAWGNQINSFSDYINIKESLNIDDFYTTFIRAPKFINVDSSCEILASYNSEPILIRNKRHLAASFHPEMGDDTRLLEYFLKFANE